MTSSPAPYKVSATSATRQMEIAPLSSQKPRVGDVLHERVVEDDGVVLLVGGRGPRGRRGARAGLSRSPASSATASRSGTADTRPITDAVWRRPAADLGSRSMRDARRPSTVGGTRPCSQPGRSATAVRAHEDLAARVEPARAPRRRTDCRPCARRSRARAAGRRRHRARVDKLGDRQSRRAARAEIAQVRAPARRELVSPRAEPSGRKRVGCVLNSRASSRVSSRLDASAQ